MNEEMFDSQTHQNPQREELDMLKMDITRELRDMKNSLLSMNQTNADLIREMRDMNLTLADSLKAKSNNGSKRDLLFGGDKRENQEQQLQPSMVE